MQKSRGIKRHVKCEFCGRSHEELEIYVKKVAHLHLVNEVRLIECEESNRMYIKPKEIEFILN